MQHSAITYRDLLNALNDMDDKDLDKSVTVRIDEDLDEVLGVMSLSKDDADGVLDSEHLILEVNR